MDEVDEVALADRAEETAFGLDERQRVPADVRDLQTRVDHPFERNDLAFQQPQTRVDAVLAAFFKQKLHPEADAEQFLALFDLAADQVVEPGLAEFVRRVSEGADAG